MFIKYFINRRKNFYWLSETSISETLWLSAAVSLRVSFISTCLLCTMLFNTVHPLNRKCSPISDAATVLSFILQPALLIDWGTKRMQSPSKIKTHYFTSELGFWCSVYLYPVSRGLTAKMRLHTEQRSIFTSCKTHPDLCVKFFFFFKLL